MKRATILAVTFALATFVSAQDKDKAPAAPAASA